MFICFDSTPFWFLLFFLCFVFFSLSFFSTSDLFTAFTSNTYTLFENMGNTFSNSCCCGGCCCESKFFFNCDIMHEPYMLKADFYFFSEIERSKTGLYEPLLQENEREAITELLQYLESKFCQTS